MFPLSREVLREFFELVLPHEHFGSHLDSQRRTVDNTLEKFNFKFAGETLSKIWSDVGIDKCPVVAECIVPESSELAKETLLTKDITCRWFQEHFRTSQPVGLLYVNC